MASATIRFQRGDIEEVGAIPASISRDRAEMAALIIKKTAMRPCWFSGGPTSEPPRPV
jgi:hypothetical protein